MPDIQPRDRIESYLAAYNRFDVEGMLAQVSADVVFENHANGTVTVSTQGIEQLRALAQQSATMFSEREQRVTGVHPQEGSTVVEIHYRGRLAVDVPGGPAAGSVLELQGQSEFWFRDGLISRIVDRS